MKCWFLLLCACVSVHLHAQTIVPNPKPGTILWRKTLPKVDSKYPPVVDAEGRIWLGVNEQQNKPPGLLAMDAKTGNIISNAIPSFNAPALRLQGRTAFFPDGAWVVPGVNSIACLGGIHDWEYPTAIGNIGFGLVTKGSGFVFPFNKGSFDLSEQRILGLAGTNGGKLFDRLLASAAPWPSYRLVGFGPGGRILAVGEKEPRFTLASFNATNGVRISEFTLQANIEAQGTTANSPIESALVTTEEGYACLSAFKLPSGQGYKELALYIVNLLKPGDSRIVVIGDSNSKVRGMIAGRNGVVYVCVSDGSGQQGEVRGIHPGTGELVFRPDYSDRAGAAPGMTADGTILVVSPDFGAPSVDGSHITAIATGSKGGIAQSPWPRSTGDNLNSFREQGVEDSDQDGLTDDQEATVYGTNPLIADTDGDGYSDGKEVEQGSNPKDKTSIPELLEIEPAIKLTFGTTTGLRYRLQYSPDLETWTDMGAAFIGTGVRSSVLVEASEKARYFRLWRSE